MPIGSWISTGPKPTGNFVIPDQVQVQSETFTEADGISTGVFCFYQSFKVDAGMPPDWHQNPVTKEQVAPNVHWSNLGDFDFGDIKNIWELSRFSFVYALLRAFQKTKDEVYPELFWTLLEDWKANNLPNRGVNWKCGQEAAFRSMACCFALWGFEGSPSSTLERQSELQELIYTLACRIDGNLDYALSQANNHGISESISLIVVGILFPNLPEAPSWKSKGWSSLIRLLKSLVYADGSFAQCSVNYQRVLLHNLSWVVAVSNKNQIKVPVEVMDAFKQATHYLCALVDPATGRVPMVGPNDGANILPLSECGYLDFRPVVQLASSLCGAPLPYPQGPWDEPLSWFGLSRAKDYESPKRVSIQTANYSVLVAKESAVYVRATRKYRHRPSHLDQLHMDLFFQGVPILCESGSYSYNNPEAEKYYPYTHAHNTVEFDGRGQMPSLSKFLFGEWTPVREVKHSAASFQGSFTDYQGCTHKRKVEFDAESSLWVVEDHVSGGFKSGCLRWRLNPDWHWQQCSSGAKSSAMNIEISGSSEISVQHSVGFESLTYGKQREIEVVEVRFERPLIIRTAFQMHSNVMSG